MPTRYIVHGTDSATGQPVRKIIEAPTAREAEEIAAKIGVKVLGSEIDAGQAGSSSVAGAANDIGHPFAGVRAGGATHPTDVQEEVVWSGTPSQWTNFWWYVACVLVVPIPFAIYNYLVVRTTRYHLTNQRLRLETGIIARHIEEVELYRINDSAVKQALIERLLGIGTVWLETSDERNPEVTLRAVPDPAELREAIRKNAEARRRWRRVAEIEVQ
jgi:membrane protein YdbS with pleckstrin-like domain